MFITSIYKSSGFSKAAQLVERQSTVYPIPDHVLLTDLQCSSKELEL